MVSVGTFNVCGGDRLAAAIGGGGDQNVGTWFAVAGIDPIVGNGGNGIDVAGVRPAVVVGVAVLGTCMVALSRRRS